MSQRKFKVKKITGFLKYSFTILFLLMAVTITYPGAEGNNLAWREISSEEVAKAAGIQKGNMLYDSSFESLDGISETIHGSKWWSQTGRIKRSGAFHGDISVESFAVSDPYCFRKDIPLTLSFYANAPEGKDIQVIVMHGYPQFPLARALEISNTGGGTNGIYKIFKGKAGWNRYSFSFMPGSFPDTPLQNFIIEINGPGNALFDAFQVEEGGLTDYTPKEKELFVNVSRREEVSNTTLFFDDENVPVTLVGTKTQPGALKAELVVEDFWKKEIFQMPVVFHNLEGKVKASMSTILPLLPRGTYRVYLKSKDVESRKIVFAVIGRNLSEGSEIMGGSVWAGLDFNRGMTEALGVTWSRDATGYWRCPRESREIWEKELDQNIAQKIKAKKIRIWTSCIALDAGNIPDPWLSDFKNGTLAKALTYPGDFYEGWLGYIREAMKHFKNVRYWESWNEPSIAGMTGMTPEKYVQLLKVFYETVKEVDSNAVVVGFSACHLSHFAMKGIYGLQAKALELGGQQYCDVISYHGYSDSWPEAPKWGRTMAYSQSLTEVLENIRMECRRVGGEKPIWDNEFTLWGTSWYDGERVPRRLYNWTPTSLGQGGGVPFDEAVSRIVHYVTIAYSHGVRMFGPHCFDWPVYLSPNQNQGKTEYDTRAYDYDFSIKPRTVSFAVICNKMNNAKLVKEDIRNDLFVYTFDKPAGSLAVVFMREGKKATLSLPVKKELLEKLSLKNVFDGPFQGVQEKDGKLTLSMVGQPVYIESQMSGQKLAGLLTSLEYDLAPLEVTSEKLSVKIVGSRKLEVALYNVLPSELKGKISIECQGKAVIDNEISLNSKETRIFSVTIPSAINNFENIPLKISFFSEGESQAYVKKDISLVLLTSKKRKSSITIDGDLSDWPEEYGVSLPDTFREFNPGTAWKGKDDLSAVLYTCWDEKNFYLALKIKDDVFTRPPETVSAYQYDNLQVYFDTRCDERDKENCKRWDENVYNYNFSPLKGGLEVMCDAAPDLKTGPAPEVKCAFREDKNGIIYEIAFPAKEIYPISLKEGSSFGFALLINDNDNDCRKRGLTLTPSGTEPHLSPHLYPVLILK